MHQKRITFARKIKTSKGIEMTYLVQLTIFLEKAKLPTILLFMLQLSVERNFLESTGS